MVWIKTVFMEKSIIMITFDLKHCTTFFETGNTIKMVLQSIGMSAAVADLLALTKVIRLFYVLH